MKTLGAGVADLAQLVNLLLLYQRWYHAFKLWGNNIDIFLLGERTIQTTKDRAGRAQCYFWRFD